MFHTIIFLLWSKAVDLLAVEDIFLCKFVSILFLKIYKINRYFKILHKETWDSRYKSISFFKITFWLLYARYWSRYLLIISSSSYHNKYILVLINCPRLWPYYIHKEFYISFLYMYQIIQNWIVDWTHNLWIQAQQVHCVTDVDVHLIKLWALIWGIRFWFYFQAIYCATQQGFDLWHHSVTNTNANIPGTSQVM